MTKELMRDLIFLARKLETATNGDLQVPQDLLDMLIANKDGCVDMAANMIGVRMQIIVFDNESTYRTMFNPEIIKKSGPYDTEASVFFFSAVLVNASAIRPSKYNGKPPNSKLKSELSLAGRHRSFNIKLTIVMGY